MLLVFAQFQHRFRSCLEQYGIQLPFVLQTQGIQLVRDGKNQVIVAGWQEFLHPFPDPFFPVFLLTIGAVPVAATVVRFVPVVTMIALAEVIPQRTGLAVREQLNDSLLLSLQLVLLYVPGSMSSEYITYGDRFHSSCTPAN
jgi:hypothetical protein